MCERQAKRLPATDSKNGLVFHDTCTLETLFYFCLLFYFVIDQMLQCKGILPKQTSPKDKMHPVPSCLLTCTEHPLNAERHACPTHSEVLGPIWASPVVLQQETTSTSLLPYITSPVSLTAVSPLPYSQRERLLLKLWSVNQWLLWGLLYKCRISSPIPDLLNHNLQFNKIANALYIPEIGKLWLLAKTGLLPAFVSLGEPHSCA